MNRMMITAFFAILAAAAAAAPDIAKWDPAMAASKAEIDTNGVKWIDGKYLPIEGRWNLGDTEHYYMRLPDNLTTNVNGGVRGMRDNTSGMLFHFTTDSDFIIVKEKPLHGWHAMNHMTQVGTSGFDVYRFDVKAGKWRFVSSEHGAKPDAADAGFHVKRIAWVKGDECIVNLPLYNGVKEFQLGIAKNAKIEAAPAWRSGITKPIVFYGTSITHGGCSSRPGLGFVNIVGRQLQVPVYGLGFSGSGVMEYELSEVISRIDASCYVLDCLWNMYSVTTGGKKGCNVEENYEKFIRNLRAKRPGVPIVMAGMCDVFCRAPNAKEVFAKRLYDRLIAEGWKDLHWLPKDGMLGDDFEGTVDGCHPNDLGMMQMAKVYGEAVKKALGL